MKKLSILVIAAMVIMGVAFASCDSRQTVPIKTEIDSASYLLGTNFGAGIKEQIKTAPGPALNMDAFADGFVKAFKGDSVFLSMDMQEVGMYLNNYFQNAQLKAMEESKAENEKFLSENGAKSDVMTTESGLQYSVISEGTGPKPKPEDIVVIHYHGTLLDGEVFDSSVDRGEPFGDLHAGDYVPGFSEGLQLMPVGSKYKFWLPSELAYDYAGPQGSPYYGKILTFEVELLEIVK